jgi:hypothetical protein
MIRKRSATLAAVLLLLVILATVLAQAQTNIVYGQVTPLVIYDDEGTAFWTAYNGGGNGSLIASVANETGVVMSGSSSIKATVTSGPYKNAGVYHYYSPVVDWSAYNTISFWMKGSNSGYYITFAIFAPTGNNLITLIHDNFTTWQSYTFDLNENNNQEGHIYTTGNPNMSRIETIEFAFNFSATVYIDRMVLTYVPLVTPTSTPTAAPTTTPTPTSTPTSTPTQPPTTSPNPTPSPSTNPPTGGDHGIGTAMATYWPWLVLTIIIIIILAILFWKRKSAR